MPRLGETFYIVGFILRSPIAVKLVSFYALFLYLALTHLLARRFLPRLYALITTLSVTSIYLLSWLGTSGYIDLFRAIFELASLYCLLKFVEIKPSVSPEVKVVSTSGVARRCLVLSALLTAFALGVKFHSLIHLFIIFIILFLKKFRLLAIGYTLLALIIASPWYIDNYLQSGHPLYPTNVPAKQLDQLHHAGASSIGEWLTSQTLKLPLLFWHLTVSPTDFLTPLILIILPLVVIQFKTLTKSPGLLLAIAYTLVALIFWWFLPPPETRYLVTLFPIMFTLGFKAVQTLPSKHNGIRKLAFIFTAVSIGLTVSFRLYASRKWLPLFTGQITRQEYIDSQTNDFNREIVTKYYSGYWQNYRYPTPTPPHTP
jgi:hypothetical protein